MRNPNRIPIVLEIFKKDLKACIDFLGPHSIFLVVELKIKLLEIEKQWLENPDQRLGQLLCNMRLITNIDTENKIWNIEEDVWLINNGYCNIEDIKFWGVNYDIDGNKLDKPYYKLLKDLDNNHIENIIKYFRENGAQDKIDKNYLRYFKERLNDRKEI